MTDESDERMRKLVEADRREFNIYGEEKIKGTCTCPVLRVGDFCPVHGG